MAPADRSPRELVSRSLPTPLPSLIFCLLGLPDGRRRTPRTPYQVLPLRPVRALSLCVFSPLPRARRSVGVVERDGSRFLRPDPPPMWGFRHVLHVARVPPERNSHSLSTSFPTPFPGCPSGRGIARPGTRPTPPWSGTWLLWCPRPCFSSGGNCRPGRPLLFTLRCPIICLQLDAFSISLNVPSPVVCRMRPPDLACSWARSGPELAAPRVIPVLVVPCSPALPIQAGTEHRPISAGQGSSRLGSAWTRPHP